MRLLPFEACFRDRRVLVTGDTGFTGSWLAIWLMTLGAVVEGLSLPPQQPENLFEGAGVGDGIRHRDVDIRDAAAVARVIREAAPDFVFHLAAQALVRRSYHDPLETYATNVLGTANVLEACRGLDGLRGVVAITTDKVYRNNEWLWGYRETDPLGGKDPYSASKAACELVIASYRDSFFANASPPVPIASARAGNIIGGGDWAADRIVPDIVRAIAGQAPLRLRNPRSTRPWQHVLSACHGYLTVAASFAARPDADGGAWNFGPESADTRSVSDVVDAFASHWTCPEVIHEPAALAEARALTIDAQRARTLLGWRPAWGFDETVARTAAWYRDHHDGMDAATLCARDIAAYRSVLLEREPAGIAGRAP